MSNVRVAPDLVGSLGLDHLQGDRAHRRDGRELDESLGLGMSQLGRDARKRIEPCDEQPRRPFAPCLVDHAVIFAAASDMSSRAALGARHVTRP